MTEPDRPLPEPITPESRPYWEGLKKHRLMLPNCSRCGPFFYPRPYCPKCHRPASGWVQASGRGRLHSFQISYQSFSSAFKIKPPYVLAMVELDEGPRLMSNLIGITPDPKAIQCDMPVEIVYEHIGADVVLPLFKPATRSSRGAKAKSKAKPKAKAKTAAGRRR